MAEKVKSLSRMSAEASATQHSELESMSLRVNKALTLTHDSMTLAANTIQMLQSFQLFDISDGRKDRFFQGEQRRGELAVATERGISKPQYLDPLKRHLTGGNEPVALIFIPEPTDKG